MIEIHEDTGVRPNCSVFSWCGWQGWAGGDLALSAECTMYACFKVEPVSSLMPSSFAFMPQGFVSLLASKLIFSALLTDSCVSARLLLACVRAMQVMFPPFYSYPDFSPDARRDLRNYVRSGAISLASVCCLGRHIRFYMKI